MVSCRTYRGPPREAPVRAVDTWKSEAEIGRSRILISVVGKSGSRNTDVELNSSFLARTCSLALQIGSSRRSSLSETYRIKEENFLLHRPEFIPQ